MYKSIYYIFKCGLHHLAIFKLFQRIIFAYLTEEFFHVKLYRILQWLRFFNFPVWIQCDFTKFEISNPIVGCCQGFTSCCNFGLHVWVTKFFKLTKKLIRYFWSMYKSIYYIFKRGLHHLAIFNLFQRIIFACLTEEFFSRLSYIVYCNG